MVTDNIRRISLGDQNEWINAINKIFEEGNERKSNKLQLVDSGYDIHVTMQSLASYWKEALSNHA